MPFVEAGNVSVNFPFEPYQCQVTYMRSVISCLQNGDNGILESPTGTGKTLCLLCSSLAWLEDKKAQIQSRRWQGGQSDGNEVLQQLKDQLANQLDEAAGAWNSELGSPKIIYASRTHSQLSQAVQELKRTAYRHFKVSVLGSREQMCIHPHIMKQDSNMAKVHLCRAKVSARTCHFYNNVEAQKPNFSNQLMDIEDLVAMGKKHNCCPYYVARELKAEADIIFMPYNYLLDPKSRRAHGVELQGNIIIFDEAHNLASMCEESASFDLTSSDIGSAIQELKDLSEKMTEMIEQEEQSAQWGREPDFNLSEDFNLKDVLEVKGQLHCLEQLLDRISLPNNGDGITKPGRYIFELFGKMNVTFSNKTALADVLDKVVTHLNNETSSSFHSRGAGLSKYADVIKIIFSQDLDGLSDICDHEALVSKYYKVHIKEQVEKNSWKKKNVTTWETPTAKPQKKGRVLSYWCFSSGYTMCNLMRQGAKCVILTSGTLSPLDSFKSEMDIDFRVQLENPHVIESSQAWIGVVGKGPDGTLLNSSYAHRFKEEYQSSLGNAVVNFTRVIPAGVLVFFPSYPVMNKCLETWEAKNIWRRIEQRKPIFVEPRGKMEFHTAIESYYDKIQDQTANGALFAAVCRGKVSEGLDFADNNGRAVIITGLPYPPRMDPRIVLKMQFLDEMISQGGKGLSGDKWYKQQATRAVNQAIGRVIRHRHDFGAILLCDNRFSAPETRDQLPAWIRPSLRVYKEFGQAMRGLIQFFKKNDELVPGKPTKKKQAEGAQFLPTTLRATPSSHNSTVKASIVTTHVDSLTNQPAEDISAASLTRQYKMTEKTGCSVQTRPTSLLDALSHTEKSLQEDKVDVPSSTVTQRKVERSGTQAPQKKKIVIKPPGGGVMEVDKTTQTIDRYLAQVKQTVSKESYRYFSNAMSLYKTSNDFDAMITCLAAIFANHPQNYHLFLKFYKFVRRHDKERFCKKCYELTGLMCGLKPEELRKRPSSESGSQSAKVRLRESVLYILQRLKSFGFNGLEDILKTSKLTDPDGHVTANLEVLCAQELPSSSPVVTQANVRPDVAASAASSGHGGVGVVAGTDMNNGGPRSTDGVRSSEEQKSTEGPRSKEGLTSTQLRSTEGPRSIEGQGSKEGQNSTEGPRSTEGPDGPGSKGPKICQMAGGSANTAPRCQIPGCSAAENNAATTEDTGASCTLHSHMPVYKAVSGYTCCHCKVDAYVPLRARCQHVCCLQCWKVCIDELKKCPECGKKVKRRHLTRLYFHSGPNRH